MTGENTKGLRSSKEIGTCNKSTHTVMYKYHAVGNTVLMAYIICHAIPFLCNLNPSL